MYRVTTHLRSIAIADTLFKRKLLECGRINLTGKLKLCRTLATIDASLLLRYGEESTTKHLQAQIVRALRLGERSRASGLILDIGSGNQSLKADDFEYILNYCAKSPDPLFVMETWRLMEEKDIVLNHKCFFLMVQALSRGGCLEEAYDLIKFLGENHGIFPLLSVYNCFLGACAKMQSVIHANQCLDLMECRRVGKNEVTYTELLKLAVWQQNLSAVHGIWKDYIKHYSLSIISLRKFIWSFTRLRDLKAAYETLQHMVALAISRNPFVTRTAEGRFYSSRLDIPIPSNGELGLDKVELREHDCSLAFEFNSNASSIEKCKSVGAMVGMLNNHKSLPLRKFLRWSFSDVIRACAQARDYGLAEQLMIQMQYLGLQPSSHTYDGFVRAAIPTRGFSAGMQMLKLMEERNVNPCASTLAAISVQCCKALELDLAEELLDQVSECPNPYPYNAFLGACDTMDQPERAVRVLAKMRQLKIQPDIRTYELLFSLFGNVNAPYEEGNMLSQVDSSKRISAIEMDMAKNGVQHSHLSMKNLLKALGSEGMMREMLQYLHVAEKLFRRTDTYLGVPIYNTVLHSLVEAEQIQMAIEFFKYMKSCGFQPNAATYSIMIDCCSTIRCFKSACAIVSMMVRDGFYPNTVAYTALIKILLEYENFDEALNLLDKADLDGCQPDVLLYNTILKKASEKGRIDIVELIVEQMHQDKVQPDPSTCHYVFSAYVDSGFHNTATEALQVLSLRMISDEDCMLEETKRQFEDAFILSEDLETESSILQFFKDSEEHLAAALLNLRWCAILGFPISWSPNRSQWARRLKSTYDARKRVVL